MFQASLDKDKEPEKPNEIEKISTKKLDLSEKPNPLKLLHSLSNINIYLRDRAKETSSFLSMFGQYTGEDYFGRRMNFNKILIALQKKDITQANKLIAQGIEEFKSFFGRQKYVDLLINLREQLNNPNVLTIDFVDQKIKNYCSIYNKMNKHTEAVNSYFSKFKFFSSNKETCANTEEARINYKLK